MKWYFASRTRHQKKIQELCDVMKSNGHEVSYEWSKLGILKPYHDNSEQCSSIADSISCALKETDIFVLFSDKEGTDMYLELGIAIGCNMFDNNSRIYAVGEFNDRSLMHYTSVIKKVDTLSDLLYQECPDIIDKIDNTLLEYFDNM